MEGVSVLAQHGSASEDLFGVFGLVVRSDVGEA